MIYINIIYIYSYFVEMKRVSAVSMVSLQWCHNERHGVSNQITSISFAQPFARAHIKENIKTPRHWPLSGESTGDRWIPPTEDQ